LKFQRSDLKTGSNVPFKKKKKEKKEKREKVRTGVKGSF
jgi:hypothetical protein